jgi:enoyl-[acyl-carrier-protein] reductase (NADH)
MWRSSLVVLAGSARGVVSAAMFLASDEASGIIGVDLVVDGGGAALV